ncbi:superoxide dismutase family protein [Cohnella fermenti]|uniref:Superoxide dismutase [Cu-Zn] n=1 Tax=Cohnella fermenti TaxID=2565925 RepID=A0A4S4C816_9BACL|nr:superoxide dismutase family protein [Cohnella fermenti]THF83472.1 superoxide dismutase family protein [Cohnella fermenti]
MKLIPQAARTVAILAFGAVLIAPSAQAKPKPAPAPTPATDTLSVTAKIINDKGAQIGTAVLTQMADTVRIQLEAEGLPPGTHGIHFHEAGKCEPPAFESAKAHFNPAGKQHGFHNPKGFHAGDLPNIVVDQSGNVHVIINSRNVTLRAGEPNSLLKEGGTALVIHEKADDYVTDPSGNSGNRIACGVIAK